MDVATINLPDAGIRKAAILVASLEPAAAAILLDQLGPEKAALVRQSAVYLEDVEPAEQRRILEEFRRIGPMVPSRAPSGIELDKMPPPSAFAESPRQSLPFEFLREAEDDKLAGLLSNERPPTVALVLSHFPPERAGEVLACLPSELQIEVVRRLVELDTADAETLREVERALESRWSKQFAVENRRSAGPDALSKILAACDGKIRGRILGNLASHDRALAERFGDRPIAFEDLARLDDATLAAIFRAADPTVMAFALLGAPPAFVDRFLSRMPPKQAKQWRRRLDRPEPIRLSDVEESRREIAALAQRMIRENPAFAA